MALLCQIQMIVAEMQQHIELLETEGGVIHPIDTSLLRDKTRSLYDVVLQLKSGEGYWPESAAASGNDRHTATKNYQRPENYYEQPKTIVAETDSNTGFSSLAEDDKNHPAVENHPAEPQPMSQERDTKSDIVSPEITQQKQKTEPQPTTLDLFGETTILADKLQVSDNSLAKKIEHSKIRDLREAIGINDKFLMINELFEGNIQYYNRALDELNSFESYNGAKTYLIELSVQHRWENHGSALERIHNLIERRFGEEA